MVLEDEIKVYTYSEMLLARSYPKDLRVQTLYGNWGWVYQKQ